MDLARALVAYIVLTWALLLGFLLTCLLWGCSCGRYEAVGPPGPPGATGSAGATGTQGARGPAGPTGPQGVAGKPGVSCTASGQTVSCSDGTQAVLTPGTPGVPGPAGPAGADGAPGAPGPAGADAPASPYNVVAVISPCPTSAVPFHEVLLRLANGELLAHYDDGAAKQFLTLVTPGAYVLTDGSGCYFTVNSDGSVTW
jgi:hypothetical protein